MQVKIWGTRGSTPVSSPETTRFGGNTTCVEVVTDAGDHIIFDAGTGIRALGDELLKNPRHNCTICLTHAHWDHLQGLPFFGPLYEAGWAITIRGSATMGKEGTKATLENIFNGRNFPLKLDNTPSSLTIADFVPGESFTAGSAHVETCLTTHPGDCVAYKVTADGWTFTFTGDHECGADAESRLENNFIKGSDVLLVDAQYTAQEYPAYQGWGHSSHESWPELAARADVSLLAMTHHDPTSTDSKLLDIQDYLNKAFDHLPINIVMAYEGMVLTDNTTEELDPGNASNTASCWLCEFSKGLSKFSDVPMMLDRILQKTRRVSMADAGTIYLIEGDELVFSYTHNDTLFPGAAGLRHVYQNSRLPLNTASLAGYTAVTGSALNIADVRKLPPNAPYKFNESFDLSTGYRTVSMLVVPLRVKENIVGVLQLINRQDAKGKAIPFSPETESLILSVTDGAALSLGQGIISRELILRMLRMTALHDPEETSMHVRRVGAVAAEVYHRWALDHGVPDHDLKIYKDQIQQAAMLHDLGKMGVSDLILKKNGPLTPEERGTMQKHCRHAKDIFSSFTTWPIDKLAKEIALNHHQKWDGTGYTGSDDDPVLAGEDIPLGARITALADVYDALISRRSYKDPMPREKARAIINKDAGTHFDPEVVEAFNQITDVIDAICDCFV